MRSRRQKERERQERREQKMNRPIGVEYELEDGEFVAMSTAPALLLKMRSRNETKQNYARLSKTLMKGMDDEDILSMYQLLYDTYVCANQEDDGRMTFEEFIERANTDIEYNSEKIMEMMKPQKKQDSEGPSREP
ncbi:hypothetical protein CS5676_0010 [Clostridium phage phiCs5676-1]|nr:hypothetical protein CS5676_0010 [Clostridium phage phiCs5676-1]